MAPNAYLPFHGGIVMSFEIIKPDELFVVINELDSNNRKQFESMLKKCKKETGISIEESIPYNYYSSGDNDGVIALDATGKSVGYMLYNVKANYSLNLLHYWVDKDYRRKQVATRMLSNIIIAKQPHIITSYVDQYLTSAHLFLNHLKFKCIRIIKHKSDVKYYFCTEDCGASSRFVVTE